VDLYIHYPIHLHGVMLKHRDNFTFIVKIVYLRLYEISFLFIINIVNNERIIEKSLKHAGYEYKQF
jgi:hypothetical protein